MANQPVRAVPPELTDALSRLDQAVTETAAEFTKLRDQVKEGMTKAEVDAYKASFDAQIARLNALKSDVQNPVNFSNRRP